MKNALRITLAAAVSLVALEASAGGFAVREQSATSQGASFAGAATSAGGLSGMFWNPAVVTSMPGMTKESHLSGIFGFSKLNPGAGSGPLTAGRPGSGDLGVPALVPSSYASYQVNDKVYVGISVNAPFGLKTKSDYAWAGQYYGRSSKAFNVVATPTLGYKVNDWLAIGVGIQVSYLDVTLKGATSNGPQQTAANFATAFAPAAASNILTGDSWAVGYTLGATLTPWQGGEIGIGFRSSLKHELNGTLQLPYALIPIKAAVNLPEIVTLGLKQKIGQNFTLLAGYEWTNWSRVRNAPIVNKVSGAAFSSLAFYYKDGWMASLGGEYQVSDSLAIRAGGAYEKSPVGDDVRSVRIPDNDRIWASIGASYKWSENLTLDASYSHVFVKDPNVRIVAGNPHFVNPAANLVASGKSHVDIFSVSLRYNFGGPKPRAAAAGVFKG